MKSFIFNFIVVSFLTSGMTCAASEEIGRQETLTFSHDHIKQHNYADAKNFQTSLAPELKEQDPTQTAVNAQFCFDDKKTLDFVGIWHDNNPMSKTHAMIQKAVHSFVQRSYDSSKKVVILEGFTPQDDTGSLQHIASELTKGKQTYSELDLAFDLARTNNIAVFTGESQYKDMEENFIKNGFCAYDHYCLTMALNLSESSYFNESILDLSSESITEIFGAYIDDINKNSPSFPENPPLNREVMITDLNRWMHEKFSRLLTTQEIKDITCPNYTQNHYSNYTDSENYLVKLKSFHQLQRDHNLLSRIESLMNHYDHVMVVYGAYHYYALHQALIETLGEPNYTFG